MRSDARHVLGERDLARLRVAGDGAPVDRVARRHHPARAVGELGRVVTREVDRLDLELSEAHRVAAAMFVLVEAARGIRMCQDGHSERAQLGDPGDVVLVRVRQQHRVDDRAGGARMGDERAEVAVAVDQHGVRARRDEIRARVPDLVARGHDRDAGCVRGDRRRRTDRSGWRMRSPSRGRLGVHLGRRGVAAGEHAAVDRQRRARDPARAVAGEEQDRLDDVRRLAVAAERVERVRRRRAPPAPPRAS